MHISRYEGIGKRFRDRFEDFDSDTAYTRERVSLCLLLSVELQSGRARGDAIASRKAVDTCLRKSREAGAGLKAARENGCRAERGTGRPTAR